MESNFFSGNLTNFIRGPLGIIALFIVLVYGFASMVVGSSDNLEYFVPLIYFMVLFPVIVFWDFCGLFHAIILSCMDLQILSMKKTILKLKI